MQEPSSGNSGLLNHLRTTITLFASNRDLFRLYLGIECEALETNDLIPNRVEVLYLSARQMTHPSRTDTAYTKGNFSGPLRQNWDTCLWVFLSLAA